MPFVDGIIMEVFSHQQYPMRSQAEIGQQRMGAFS
jgi:hypothetical protein